MTDPFRLGGNTAGISQIGKPDGASEEAFDRFFRVHVKGVYRWMQAVIDRRWSREEGTRLALYLCFYVAPSLTGVDLPLNGNFFNLRR